MKKLYVFCAVMVCGGLLIAAATRGGQDLPLPARAKAICRGEIKKRLKDPDSAEFGRSSAQQNAAGDWIVYRELTAENGFGATVKLTLVCTLAPDLEVINVARAN